MRKKILLVASLSIMALGLASCSSNLATKEYEVESQTNVDNLKPVTVFIPEGVKSSSIDGDQFLLYELTYVYSIDDWLRFAEYYPEFVQDEYLSSKRNGRLEAVNAIPSKYKSFTMTLEYVKDNDSSKNTILKQTTTDFETGNLYYSEHDYTDVNGARTETLSLETKAICDDDKFVIASNINVNRYCESDRWGKTYVDGVGNVITKGTDLYQGTKKIYTTIPLNDAMENGYYRDKESILKMVNNFQNIDFMQPGLLTSYSVQKILASEDWSSMYYSIDADSTGMRELRYYVSDYLLKKIYTRGTEYNCTVYYQLNEKSVIDSNTNLTDYTNFSYDKEDFSVSYLVQGPYDLNNETAMPDSFVKKLFKPS